MEKSRRNVLVVLIFLSCLIIAMFLCASLGYFWSKKSAPQKSDAVNTNQYDTAGIYRPLKRPQDLKEAFSATEEIPAGNKCDYLIISEGTLVNLYVLNPDGSQTFRQILDINKNSLTEADRTLLNQGIILDTHEEVWSLLEDYTS